VLEVPEKEKATRRRDASLCSDGEEFRLQEEESSSAVERAYVVSADSGVTGASE